MYVVLAIFHCCCGRTRVDIKAFFHDNDRDTVQTCLNQGVHFLFQLNCLCMSALFTLAGHGHLEADRNSSSLSAICIGAAYLISR